MYRGVELKIEQIKLSKIKPYIGNAKQYPDWHVNQIAKSIQEFGFNDPIAIDEKDTIIEGHGRAMAAEVLGLETIPVIRLSHMNKEQKNAYIIAHNQLTMNSDFDSEKLRVELNELKEFDFDLTLTGVDLSKYETPDFFPAGENEQGKLDQLESKWVTCPHCSERFDARES